MTSIVHLEDNVLDHRLVGVALRELPTQVSLRRVETEAEFRAAILDPDVQLVLADYSLPQFDGMSALHVLVQVRPDVPFLIVSGAMGEVAVVEALKAGATDYVLKDHLERLVPAVRRALREGQERMARQQAELEVREARDAAEAANRAKDHFLAVLSHELRTPLTPVLTAIQTMELDPSLSKEFRETIQMVRRNVELEVKLIDDLLDLTRVSRGKLELNLQPVDAHESLRQVLTICDSDFRGKSLAVNAKLDAARFTVMADPARFQQILWNLMKNAVKFTAEGGTVTVATRNVDEALEVDICDTGIGIEAEALHRIFDAFEQGGKQVTRQFGGLGLGLAISRSLAEQHRGSLAASSGGKDCGSTFTLRFPLCAAPSKAAPVAAPNGQPADSLANVRILLVDDHLDTAKAMARLLRRWGCDVQTADTVASALKTADASSFDLLISDIGLPDGSGLDLVRQIQARYPIKGIAVSGFGMEEDLSSSKRAGFAEHLVKPIDLKRLETAVRKVLASN